MGRLYTQSPEERARDAVQAEHAEIAELCTLAGVPEQAATFIAAARKPRDVLSELHTRAIGASWDVTIGRVNAGR